VWYAPHRSMGGECTLPRLGAGEVLAVRQVPLQPVNPNTPDEPPRAGGETLFF